jgi:hypothetical protein
MDCTGDVITFERDQKAATTDQTNGRDRLLAHLLYETYIPKAGPRPKQALLVSILRRQYP